MQKVSCFLNEKEGADPRNREKTRMYNVECYRSDITTLAGMARAVPDDVRAKGEKEQNKYTAEQLVEVLTFGQTGMVMVAFLNQTLSCIWDNGSPTYRPQDVPADVGGFDIIAARAL